MVSVVTKVDTAHRDIILKPSGQTYPLAELSGHDGPVWQVVWAHPKFDNILASCSYDRKVMIWKEISGKWQKIYEWSEHEASVNSICWAPHQFGLTLACASTDTTVSLLTYVPETNAWTSRKILKAHDQGCNAVSWAPAVHSQSIVEAARNSIVKRIVSGGNDNFVKIWKEKNDGTWELEHALKGHTDWVRDVAWAPAMAQPINTIASCGQDRKVIIWRCSNVDEGQWTMKELGNFDDALWHVSWSLCATILAVSGGDNKISLWKESLQNLWVRISETEEEKQDT